MAQEMAGSRDLQGGFEEGEEEVLQPDDVSLSVG